MCSLPLINNFPEIKVEITWKTISDSSLPISFFEDGVSMVEQTGCAASLPTRPSPGRDSRTFLWLRQLCRQPLLGQSCISFLLCLILLVEEENFTVSMICASRAAGIKVFDWSVRNCALSTDYPCVVLEKAPIAFLDASSSNDQFSQILTILNDWHTWSSWVNATLGSSEGVSEAKVGLKKKNSNEENLCHNESREGLHGKETCPSHVHLFELNLSSSELIAWWPHQLVAWHDCDNEERVVIKSRS